MPQVYLKNGTKILIPSFAQVEERKFAFLDSVGTCLYLGRVGSDVIIPDYPEETHVEFEINGGFKYRYYMSWDRNHTPITINTRRTKIVDGEETQISAASAVVNETLINGQPIVAKFTLINKYNPDVAYVYIDTFINPYYYANASENFIAEFNGSTPNRSTVSGDVRLMFEPALRDFSGIEIATYSPRWPRYVSYQSPSTTPITWKEFTHGGEGEEKPDPYEGGGTSEEGGGEG